MLNVRRPTAKTAISWMSFWPKRKIADYFCIDWPSRETEMFRLAANDIVCKSLKIDAC